MRGLARELGSEMSRKVGLAVAALEFAAAIACHTTPAAAQGGVRVGTLSCNVASGWGFVFGSSKALNCTLPAWRPSRALCGFDFKVRCRYRIHARRCADLGGICADHQFGARLSRRELSGAPPRVPRSGSGPGPMC